MDALGLAKKHSDRLSKRTDKLVKSRTRHDEPDPSAAEPTRAQAAQRKREAKAASSARYGRMPWSYVLSRTLREYGRDGCSDLAAGLTYFSVLSALPALLALVSVLGLLGAGHQGSKTLLEVVDAVAPQQVQPVLSELVTQLTSSTAAGIGLVVGIVGAVWSASGYVGAFTRAVNRIYGVSEGRSTVVLRSQQVLITVVVLVLVVLVVLSLVLSGPLARTIGTALGVGDAVFTTWEVIKWPLIGVSVILAVVVLFFGAPNLRHLRLRYVATGAAVAVVVMVLGSLAFGFYTATFASYNRIYGTVGGLLVALLWVWLANLALVIGAELGSELHRGHELSLGLPAETAVLLSVRGKSASEKAAAKLRGDVAVGAAIRTAVAAQRSVV
ncbi:YihY/virulence factor BrkB family protein [Planctomonas sp. JC2975]|uniref:YihY/virulence factor BrkB family protein n=1 Tax=Planctomonas sp. JC2975 TaxID=2729626 RepID=UPI00147340DA|nr:YihY/virulence factor BrkB family protein [Planctomonas sp. JC2975]NNC10374.1 YihY/virulence factor BrkB family protein [Planctomonas sp. JC2975]